jgi:hypothetical protein
MYYYTRAGCPPYFWGIEFVDLLEIQGLRLKAEM